MAHEANSYTEFGRQHYRAFHLLAELFPQALPLENKDLSGVLEAAEIATSRWD